jgi:hypothetical protein
MARPTARKQKRNGSGRSSLIMPAVARQRWTVPSSAFLFDGCCHKDNPRERTRASVACQIAPITAHVVTRRRPMPANGRIALPQLPRIRQTGQVGNAAEGSTRCRALS